MRKVVYGGAMSLDGFIAGPNGEYDWIVPDPDVDFAAEMRRFDTFLIGRKTYDMMRRAGRAAPVPGIVYFVFSRTLQPNDCPQSTLSGDAVQAVTKLKAGAGKDIALFGGGELFRSLLAADLVDEIRVNMVPILLSGGIAFLPPPAKRTKLKLKEHKLYPKTGTVSLTYDIL